MSPNLTALSVLFIFCMISANFAHAQDERVSGYRYILANATSSDKQGIIITVCRESKGSRITASDTPTVVNSVELRKVGAEPINISSGCLVDNYNGVAQTRDECHIVSVHLTEKDEPITIITDGMKYYVATSSKWNTQNIDELIDFTPRGELPPREALSTEVSGSLADRNIVIALRERNQGKHYNRTWFFTQTSSRELPHWRLVQNPKHVKVDKPTTGSAGDPGSDLMGAYLIDQQIICSDIYLLTVMVQSSTSLRIGDNKAVYYFLQNAAEGNELQYVSNVTSKHLQDAKTDLENRSVAHPNCKLSGSASMPNSELSLSLGMNMLYFRYDHSSKKWVRK